MRCTATLINSTALSCMYSHTHIPWHRTKKLMKKSKEKFPNMLKSSTRKVSNKNLNFSKWPAAGSDSLNALLFRGPMKSKVQSISLPGKLRRKLASVGTLQSADADGGCGRRMRTADGGRRTADGGRRTADGGRRTADGRIRTK